MNGVLQILEVVGQHGTEDSGADRKGPQSRKSAAPHSEQHPRLYEAAHCGRQCQCPQDRHRRCLSTVAELHTAAAAAKGIDLRSRLDLPPTGESLVFVDEVKLFEIINNLVVQRAEVHVERVSWSSWSDLSLPTHVPLPHATLHIRVSDSGPGIAEDDWTRSSFPSSAQSAGGSRHAARASACPSSSSSFRRSAAR